MSRLVSNEKLSRGFTLIELLVVIAIIAILAAILFPVFQSVRENARKTACLSNQKQIAYAVFQYTMDADEMFPQEHPPTQNPAVDDNNSQLESADYGSPFEKIMPYVSRGNSTDTASLTEQIFTCPDDFDPHGLTLGTACTSTAPAPGVTSYLVNAYFLFGCHLSQLQSPASTIYTVERDSAFCDVHVHPWLGEIYKGSPPATPTACPVQPDVPNPNGLFAPASQRHQEGANYGFADGHAKWERYETTVQNTDSQPCFGQYQAF